MLKSENEDERWEKASRSIHKFKMVDANSDSTQNPSMHYGDLSLTTLLQPAECGRKDHALLVCRSAIRL